MRLVRFHVAVVVGLLAGLLALACGGAPQGCPGMTSGSADQAAFATSFSAMGLARQGGAPIADNVVFAPADTIEIAATALQETQTRLCVQSTASGGKVQSDKTQAVAKGDSRVAVGKLTASSYVVRVFVGSTLVKNLPFTVK